MGIWLKPKSMTLMHGPCRFQSTLLHDILLSLRTRSGDTEDTERLKPWLEAGASAGLDFPGEHWSLVSEVRQLTVEKDVGSVRHETPHNTLGLGRTVRESTHRAAPTLNTFHLKAARSNLVFLFYVHSFLWTQGRPEYLLCSRLSKSLERACGQWHRR